MIEKSLQEIILLVASGLKFRPILVEKDYYLTLILNNIESLLSGKLVFKGGTLLNKVHLNYHRLSEDLDFTYLADQELTTRTKRSKAIAPIREKMDDFLKHLNLKSDNPKGEGFNNSTQYTFGVFYPSFITPQPGKIKIEISLRQKPVDKPVYNTINHFYQDPFTGEDLIPKNKILSLSLNEAVAEKLKAAITRKEAAIRDFYDLWHIAKAKFDFHDKRFIFILKKKLAGEGYQSYFRRDFGLPGEVVSRLKAQVKTDLIPIIRSGEKFDLDRVFELFNGILMEIK